MNHFFHQSGEYQPAYFTMSVMFEGKVYKELKSVANIEDFDFDSSETEGQVYRKICNYMVLKSEQKDDFVSPLTQPITCDVPYFLLKGELLPGHTQSTRSPESVQIKVIQHIIKFGRWKDD